MFWSFAHEACAILVPGPGIKLNNPALKDKVLTAGIPGKS